jgi:serine/threonine-protein kinase RsbW
MSSPNSQQIQPGDSTGPALSSDSNRVLVLTACFENLDPVRDFAASAAEDCGLEPAAVYAVQMAVDEAFSNIIEHAYGGESQQEKIECTCEITPHALTVYLRDCGKPFDPTIVPEPDIEASLEEREVGGLGLFFMHRLMDEVTFHFAIETGTGRVCNILKMIKRKER